MEKVSVILPVYNDSLYIVDAIESVLHQTYSNIELIVVNDGSDDDGLTEKAIFPYLNHIVYCSKKNGGVSSARNQGLDMAKGDIIAFLDSDDIFKLSKIEKQLNFMKQLNLDFSYTCYEKVSINKEKLGTVRYPKDPMVNNYPSILSSCGIATPTVMATRKVFLNRKFREDIDLGEDVCLWIDISYQHKIGLLNEVLTKVRIDNNTAAYCVDKLRTGVFNIIDHIMNNEFYKQENANIYLLTHDFAELFHDKESINKKNFQNELKKLRKIIPMMQQYGVAYTVKKIFYYIKKH